MQTGNWVTEGGKKKGIGQTHRNTSLQLDTVAMEVSKCVQVPQEEGGSGRGKEVKGSR